MASCQVQIRSGDLSLIQKRSKGRGYIDFLVFVAPCLRFAEFRIVGVLNGADISLLIMFLALALRSRIKIATRAGRVFIVFCLGWLISQGVTDIVRHSAFADYSRGWSNIGMTLINFIVLYVLLYGRPSRILLYGWGLVLGTTLTYFINPSDQAIDYPWKFGLADSVNWAVLLLSSTKGVSHRLQIALISIMGILNIIAGTRNQGGVCLMVALYLVSTRFMRNRSKTHGKADIRLIAGVGVSMLLGVLGVALVYQNMASSGALGEQARYKYEQQSSGKYGLLLGGRTEILGSLPAIFDSPILGHGSWARDPSYLIAERQALALMGYSTAEDITPDELEEGLIPAHSYIFGAWVSAGIVGAIFWGWVFYFTVKSLMRVPPREVILMPLACYFAFSLLWELLFSPYGAQSRVIMPFYVVTIMSCMMVATSKSVLKMQRRIDGKNTAV